MLEKQSVMEKDIENLKKQVAKLAIRNQEDVSPLFMLPDRADWFSGRESELDNLHTLLQMSQDISETKVQITSVCGLGGSGKTSVAAEYAHRQKDFYEGGVFWFSGEDEEKFANSVDEHAVYFGTILEGSPGRTLVKTLDLISKIETPWLLVLDDMDEFKLSSDIGMLLSGPWKRRVRGSGNILITTRRKPKVMSETIKGFKESQCLQLGCFNPDDAKEFIFKRTGLDYDKKASTEAACLVETLGGLPLALEQACAYIRNLSCSLSDYLEQYKRCSLELLDEKVASSASLNQSPERLAVSTTWLLNFEYIKKSKNGSHAVRFLHACAFFNPTEIQKDLINPGKPPIEDETYRDYVNTPLGSPNILQLLTDFSLFQRNKGSSLSVHRLVQEVIREKLRLENQEILSLVDAICMLSFSFSSSKCPTPDNLSLSNIDTEHDRASSLATNPSLFHSWRKLCLHAREILSIINSFKVLPKEILTPKTAKIIYECALDFNISGKTDKATQCVEFAHKIINLGGTSCDLAALFPHQIPLSELVRRYIFYSCLSPPDTADSSFFDNRTGSKCKMEKMYAEGNSHFNDGNFQKSVEMYSSAMAEVSSFEPKFLCDRAFAYINLRQYENSLADLENYLSRHSKCWFGLALKALALHGLNEIWEASSFAALAFYYNRDIFRDFHPFKVTFSALENRIYICNSPSLLIESLFKAVSDPQAPSASPGKIVLVDPGDYHLDVSSYPLDSLSFKIVEFWKIGLVPLQLIVADCILLGVDDSKSSVIIHFKEETDCGFGIMSNKHVMVRNISFVFLKGNWETQVDSVTTFINCSFESSSDESNYTFHSLGTDTFKNCSFDNCKSPGLTVQGKTNVEKCVFSGGEYSGVGVDDGGCLEMSDCQIFGHGNGMYIANAIQMCKVRDCEIFDNKRNGINVDKNALNVIVQNCRIYQNDRHGIFVDEDSSALILKNEIFENAWQGISSIANGRCTISHNRIYRNKSGGVQVVPVDSRKPMAPSVVEYNEIFDNVGHNIYCEMMVEDTPSDTSVSVTGNTLKQLTDYLQSSKYLLKAECTGNEYYNCKATISSAASMETTVEADFCSYCRKKCSLNCGSCFVITYCNRECQRRDWKKHKKECRSILEKFTVLVNVSLNKDLANLELAKFVPCLAPEHPGLEPKGAKHAPKPKSGERFSVKILAADEEWHSNAVSGPVFIICDRSLNIKGFLDRKSYPHLFNMVIECGVSSSLVEGWKKKFFWAKLVDESCNKLRVFTKKFPAHQGW